MRKSKTDRRRINAVQYARNGRTSVILKNGIRQNGIMVTHYKDWASACIDLHCCLGFYYSPKLVVADLVEVEYNISDERREKP